MKKQTKSRPKITKKSPEFDFSEFERDKTAIPSDIREKLEKEGKVPRWISKKTLERYMGRHPKGWEPVKIESDKDSVSLFGSGPSDYFQRGDLVLAAKTKEKANLHRAYLDKEAKISSVKQRIKRDRQEFKDQIRSNNLQDYLSVETDD